MKIAYQKMLPVEVMIAVPSGMLVVANDLRDLWPEVQDDFNVNSSEGLKLTIEAYGKANLFHGYVGNSCPSVYKDGDTIHIGNNGHGDDVNWDKITDELPGERVAGVCTDLWWYSICDYYEYIKRGGDPNDKDVEIVKVNPGPHTLKHYWPFSDSGDSYRKSRMIYASIYRVYNVPNEWRLVEEDLAKDLKFYLNDLDYVYAGSDEHRTSFKVWGALQAGSRKTFFTVHVPAKDLGNRAKVAIAIRKEGMVQSRKQLACSHFWKNFDRGIWRNGLSKIFDELEEEKE